MRNHTTSRSIRIGLLAAALLGASACAGGGHGSSAGDGQVKGNVNTVNTAKVRQGGTVTYTITYPISNWNVLNSQGATYSVIDISSVLLPDAFDTKPDGSSVINDDLLRDAKKVKNSPQTVRYTIKPDAQWSDGAPITAKDFVYTWHALDPRHCPKCEASNTAGYNRIKSLTGSNGGRTVSVVFDRPYVDWKALFSPFLPAHIAQKYGDITTAAGLAASFNKGFGKNVPKWSAGPFRIKKFTSDGSVVMVRNKKWYGSKPHLKKLIFRLITDVAQQPTSLANHEVDIIYPAPQVDIVQQVDELPGVKYQISPQYAVHMIWLNMNAAVMHQKPLRKAIFQAIDVPQLVDKTIGQFDKSAKQLKDHIYVQDAPGYQDVVSQFGYGVGSAKKAKQTLKDAGYKGVGTGLAGPDGDKIPTLRFTVKSGDKLRNSEAQLVKSALAPLGIDVKIANVPNTVDSIQKGNWAITNGTVTESPYAATANVPYYMSCPQGVTFCRFNLGNYGNPKVDKLLKSALSATSQDEATEDLHRADQIISSDYAVLPLYQNRTFLAYNGKLGNVRENGLAFPTYNTEDWGWAGDK